MRYPLFKKIIAYRPCVETSVGAAIYRERNGEKEFLLLRYPHGHWDFVKGHKEKGESDIETLKRETEEETGLTNFITIHKKFKKTVYYYYRAKGTEVPKRIGRGNGLFIFKRVIYYAAKVKDQKIHISDEHIGWRWMTHERALKRLTFDNARSILQAFKEL